MREGWRRGAWGEAEKRGEGSERESEKRDRKWCERVEGGVHTASSGAGSHARAAHIPTTSTVPEPPDTAA